MPQHRVHFKIGTSIKLDEPTIATTEPAKATLKQRFVEVGLLMCVFCIYAGDIAPQVNEAHYLVKAKNFWNPDWCRNDLFASSGKAHTTFYYLFGWPTRFFTLETTAWIGRIVGWLTIAIGLQSLTSRITRTPLACLGVAVIWIAGIEYANLAGEWVIGGIEAKVPAYGFVLLAMARMIDRRWNQVWILLGIASAFHVLSGGWSVVAATVAWLMTERNRKDRRAFFTPGLFIGGAIALLGLVPALALTLGVDPKASGQAAEIYTYFRIRHHLLPHDLKTWWYVRHGLLIGFAVWLFVTSQSQGEPDNASDTKPEATRRAIGTLGYFAAGAVSIAVVGLLIGLLPPLMPKLAAKLLRYYWFRLADAVVPLFVAVAIIAAMNASFKPLRRVAFAGLILCTIGFGISSIDRWRAGVPPSGNHRYLGFASADPPHKQQQVFADWLAVCHWAKHATPEDEIFITPRHQQSFKWYAHRAEIVNWKDVPQDAESLVEWRRRFYEVYPTLLSSMRATIKHSTLRRFRKEYGVRFMIVDQRIVDPKLKNVNLPLVRIYPIRPEDNRTYAVYELPFAVE